jgi:small subunit ribosomal protein S9
VAEAKTTKKKVYLGTGRRKSSVARVRLSEGTGKIVINGKPLDQYFTELKDRNAVTAALEVTDLRMRLDVNARVNGGGITGQSGALLQGVARAIKEMFGLASGGDPKPAAPSADGQPADEPAAGEGPPSMAKRLRDSGYLTRDGRMKERKKYGRKGARKSFQFSKR